MAVAELPSSKDVWKSSSRLKSPDFAKPFAWRRRLGVIRSSDNSIQLNDGRKFEIDDVGKINGVDVYNLKKEDLR